MSSTTHSQDSITREVAIDAPLDVVWELVSRPGWWINDGAVVDNAIEESNGVLHVTNATYGTFPLVVDGSREPNYVAFRWAPWDERVVESGSTLVEFFVEGPADGPVTVKVVESGFASLPLDPGKVAENYRENESGWEAELGALKTAVESR